MIPPYPSLRRNKAVGSPAAGLRLLEQVLLAATALAVAGTFTDALAAAPARYLFLDPAFVREAKGATLRTNPPLREDRVMVSDRPWEQLMISFYTTVRDDGGRLRMWYICRDQQNRGNVAYAESNDGLNWKKPELGVVDYEGSKANNLVGLPSLEGAVYRDPKGAGDEQYVYLSTGGGGLLRFTSPDGLRWKRHDEPLVRFQPDTQTVAFWDEQPGRYRVYTRGKDPKGPHEHTLRRHVVLLETESLVGRLGGDAKREPGLAMRDLPVMLKCDERDPPDVDVYTNAIQPYPLDPQWYVGFPAFYRHYNGNSPHFNDGRTEVQFVGSRDGATWHRYGREVYAGPGPPGPLSGNMIFMGTGLVVRGDEIWQYGTRYRTTHGDKPGREQQTDGAIHRFVHRVDGFVSLDTGEVIGTARTAPVKITGRRLLLNLDTGALGGMQVGLLDPEGRPLPGFRVEDCRRLEVDSTSAAVTWADGANLSAILGRSVAFEFRSSRTKLYSARFEN
jgi:hypothetical protein